MPDRVATRQQVGEPYEDVAEEPGTWLDCVSTEWTSSAHDATVEVRAAYKAVAESDFEDLGEPRDLSLPHADETPMCSLVEQTGGHDDVRAPAAERIVGGQAYCLIAEAETEARTEMPSTVAFVAGGASVEITVDADVDDASAAVDDVLAWEKLAVAEAVVAELAEELGG